MSLEGFRRGAQSVISQKSGKGGRKGNYHLQWKPPVLPQNSPNPVAEPVVFIDAEYPDLFDIDPKTGQPQVTPMYHGREHTFRNSDKDIRTLICSAGADPHHQQPCVGCYETDHGRKGSGARDFCAFNVAHLVPYHMVPYQDREGRWVMKQDKPTEYVLVARECGGRQCQACASGYTAVFGQHRIFKVGSGHLQTIFAISQKVGNTCANCNSNIVITHYDCPSCTAIQLEVATCGWTDEQLANFAKEDRECYHCHQRIRPREVIDCGFDPRGATKLPGRGCPDNVEPKRLSLFDVAVYLQREGSGKDTKVVELGFVPLSQFPTPDQRPLPDVLKEIVKSPFNFAEQYAPESVADQAQRLGVPNPFTAMAAPAAPYPSAPGFGGPPAAPHPGYPAPAGGPQYPVYGNAQPPPVAAPQQQGGYPPQYPNVPQQGRPQYGK